ncbi:hypothetical protein MCNS_13000 [Mycobacterium conspicuum]|jgi:hypothetical protein|uniref:Uncharacterized protein n=1 Tax=Mycobacterium conspicuum TaxID=44010 RepID=A0A7I7Y9E5_9MYCO|nr:hypothetical protein MCNS_13000 [Mycobacterium conspicuum]BBZ48889.1 hypothetical protein MHEI_06060 [Mycobacterium heidelbergense]
MFKTPAIAPTVAEIAARPHKAIRFLLVERAEGSPLVFRVSETTTNETAPAAKICAEVNAAA